MHKSPLEEYEDNLTTAMGAWFPGQRVVFRGKDLFSELVDLVWLQLIFFSINGKVYEDKHLKFMNAAFVICSSYPDPRIWNNRVAAFAGSVRSTASLALSAATAVSEATAYGRRPDLRSHDLFVRAKSYLDGGGDLGEFVELELKKYRGIAGYGRPLIQEDERIQPLLAMAKKCGVDNGTHLQISFKIENYLKEKRRRMQLNVAGLLAAIMADIGTSSREHYLCCVLAFAAGNYACFLDAETHQEGSLFPLSVKRINYQGSDERVWV